LEYTITDEERKRRSEWAKANVANGKFGGVEHGKKGGRPIGGNYKKRMIKQLVESIYELPDHEMFGVLSVISEATRNCVSSSAQSGSTSGSDRDS
jgi:hypothetical protein